MQLDRSIASSVPQEVIEYMSEAVEQVVRSCLDGSPLSCSSSEQRQLCWCSKVTKAALSKQPQSKSMSCSRSRTV
jgi:hypothetical protein